MDHEIQSARVSALDMDVLGSAYREMVGNAQLDGALARRHARDLVHALTGVVDIDDELISRIIRR